MQMLHPTQLSLSEPFQKKKKILSQEIDEMEKDGRERRKKPEQAEHVHYLPFNLQHLGIPG